MAQQAAADRGLSIRLACAAFSISETCYRYQPKLSDENAGIADWLIRLTHDQRDRGFYPEHRNHRYIHAPVSTDRQLGGPEQIPFPAETRELAANLRGPIWLP